MHVAGLATRRDHVGDRRTVHDAVDGERASSAVTIQSIVSVAPPILLDVTRKRDLPERVPHAPVSERPALLDLWHPTRNTVSPTDITTGSTRKVWWICPEGPDHAWEAALQSVANSVSAGHRGCPYCRGLRASATNSVRALMPLSAAQWHPTKNGDLAAHDVAAGSNRAVWWKCAEGPDHEWQAKPCERRKRSDGICPFCVNRRVSVTNMLSLKATDVAAHWHVIRNGDLTPDQVVVSTQRAVWWQCPIGPDHEWQSPVHWRTVMGFGCPFCSGRRVSVTNSVRTLMPTAVQMWHSVRNGDLTPDDVLAGSGEPIWWKCPEGPDHEWTCAPVVLKRSLGTKNRGCPFCAGNRASVTNSLSNHPHLAAEVHPIRNGNLEPDDIPAGTATKIWWQCSRGSAHEWRASVVNRVRGRNCPFCKTSLRSVWETCLAYELQTLFDGIDLMDDKINDNGNPIHVDILIPSLRIALEVDGRYHHVNRHDADSRKSRRIRNAGWVHLRIREESLGAINEEDVLVPDDVPIKPAMDALLTRLLELGWVTDRATAIEQYLAEDHPRRMDEAVEDVQRARNGRKVARPGRIKGPNRDILWQTGYTHLLAYVEREGHAQPPFSHREAGYRLGSWVSVQRKRHRTGVLKEDRSNRLASLPGWSWDALATTFDRNFALYAAYVRRSGHAYIYVAHREEDVNLGSWVRGLQRGRIRLTDDQRVRLEGLPGWSWERSGWTESRAPMDKPLFGP